MDPFKEEKFLPTEDGLGKLSNTANLIAIFERSLKLTTNKLLQKENPETIRPIARTRREAMKFRISKSGSFFFNQDSLNAEGLDGPEGVNKLAKEYYNLSPPETWL